MAVITTSAGHLDVPAMLDAAGITLGESAELDRQLEEDRQHQVPAAAEVELTDELAAAFLEELGNSGSIKTAARAIGVSCHFIYKQLGRNPQFRHAWDQVRGRRLQDAADELFFAMDALSRVLVNGQESALDELINVYFQPAAEPPVAGPRPGVDPAQLSAARARFRQAGKRWAAAVLYTESREWTKLVEVS